VQSTTYRLQYGVFYAGGARDSDGPPTVINGRAERALRNFLETYPAFVALSLAIVLADRSDALTVWGSQLYFWSRWVYLPLYLVGVQFIRSLFWVVSAIGLMLMFFGVAF
jgi:uncharacterized MAPEG superfamily protein